MIVSLAQVQAFGTCLRRRRCVSKAAVGSLSHHFSPNR